MVRAVGRRGRWCGSAPCWPWRCSSCRGRLLAARRSHIRIDEAEQEIVRLADEIVASTGLEVTSAQTLGRREPCELVTTGAGASNRVSFRGPIPEGSRCSSAPPPS
jgi:hypothetical protein